MVRDVVFVDEVNMRSVLYIVLRAYKTRHVYYFTPLASPWNGTWFQCLFRTIGVALSPITQNMGQVRDRDGNEAYISIYNDVWGVCEVIRQDHLERSSFLASLGGVWDVEKVVFHFLKTIELELRIEFLRVRLAGSIIENSREIARSGSYLLIRRSAWHDYLATYAASYGTVVKTYSHSTIPFAKILTFACRVTVKLGQLIFARAKGLAVQGRGRGGSPDTERPARGGGENTHKIGLRYFYRSVSFDPGNRSEFFWLHGSKIKFSQVVLYDYAPRVQGKHAGRANLRSDEEICEFEERGAGLYGMGARIPRWIPSGRSIVVFLGVLGTLLGRWIRDLLRGGKPSFYYLRSTLGLGGQFAYWVDFFGRNNILINLTVCVNSSSAQVLAMDRLGGVSLSYQYSCSDFIFDYPIWLSAGEDAHLVFSSFLRSYMDSLKTPTRYLIPVGYIYSSLIEASRESAEVAEVRSDLARHGAQFVIGFFDENSADLWYVTGSHKTPRQDYAFLLNWLLEDPTLGLVIKPKSAPNLMVRLGPVADLLERALETGRCHIFMSDKVVGETYPAKVALISDLCIGIEIGTTAAFEARLAGVPTLLIEHSELANGLFAGRNTEQIIFDDWAVLRQAVEQWRALGNPAGSLGDWSDFIMDLDPFNDEKCNDRISDYIAHLYEALRRGVGKDQALMDAHVHYSEKWGVSGVR
jgi:hypothetical protein